MRYSCSFVFIRGPNKTVFRVASEYEEHSGARHKLDIAEHEVPAVAARDAATPLDLREGETPRLKLLRIGPEDPICS
jgi:hypothetical protein